MMLTSDIKATLCDGVAKFAVRKDGIIEAKNLPTCADNATAVTGGLAIGTIYQTATGELRIVV